MEYRVVWTDDATTDFMEIWTSADERAAVTAASRFIDQVLGHEPFSGRHEVVNGFGTVIRSPMGVDFWVDEMNRTVYVTAAWPFSEGE